MKALHGMGCDCRECAPAAHVSHWVSRSDFEELQRHADTLEVELARLRLPGETFRVHRSEMLELLSRLDRAEAQVTELQRRNTELVEEAREARDEAMRMNAIALGECAAATEFAKRLEALEGDGK